MISLAQGHVNQAIEAWREGLEIEEANIERNLTTLTDAQRQAYAATLLQTTQKAISLNLQSAPQSPEAAHLALTTLLRRKGRILEASIDNVRRLRRNLTPEDQDIFDQLIQTQRQLAALAFNVSDEIPPTQYRDRLNELEGTVNQLESILARRSAAFRAESTSVVLSAVQSQIPSNGVLVEYVRYQPFNARNPQDSWGNPRYSAYLLFPDGHIEAVDLGNAAEIDAAIQSFTQLLQNRQANFQARGNDATIVIQVNPEQVENTANHIRSLIYDPIASYLSDRDHLLISPDSQLNLLPFEALQTENGRYLVEQYQISYLNSGRDLLRLDALDAMEVSRAPAVVLADPDYDLAVGSGGMRMGEVSGELRQFRVEALPGTAREAEALRSLLPNGNILTGSSATEEVLKQVQSPSILHIATHGFFLENQVIPTPDDISSIAHAGGLRAFPRVSTSVENPLLRSGLALAGFNQRVSGVEDGVFTALEAANLNLSGTQLVVLSACDTALGDIANGEGVYGLQRAFAIAGAETQLISLWQVSDDGTESLMTRYYENLMAGMSRSESLRDVQLEMIRSEEQYSHPYYWSAFILTGDWRPMTF
jgi:CHAT domain-containing protein